MNETIKKCDTATLWALMGDLSQLMELRKMKPNKSDNAFMFWYGVYKELESEINRRLVVDYMEG